MFAQPDFWQISIERVAVKTTVQVPRMLDLCHPPWHICLHRWVCGLTSDSFSMLSCPILPRNLTSSAGLLWLFSIGLCGKHQNVNVLWAVSPSCAESSRVRLWGLA